MMEYKKLFDMPNLSKKYGYMIQVNYANTIACYIV
jgi:hypothetical protein